MYSSDMEAYKLTGYKGEKKKEVDSKVETQRISEARCQILQTLCISV